MINQDHSYRRVRSIYTVLAMVVILAVLFITTRRHDDDGGMSAQALTTNTIPKALSPSTLGNSSATDNGTTFAISEVTTTSAGLLNGGQLKMGGTVAVTGVSASLIDYAPAGITTAAILDVTNTTAIAATGISAGQVTGQVLIIRNNINSVGTINFVHQDGSSAAANQFALAGSTNWVMRQGTDLSFYYNGSKWVQFAAATFTFPALTIDGATALTGAVTAGSTFVATGAVTGGTLQSRGALIVGATTAKQEEAHPEATAPIVDHGSLSADASNFMGRVTAVGGNTSVTLTFGDSGFAAFAHCFLTALSGTYTNPGYIFVSSGSKTAPVFSCFVTIGGGVAAVPGNCPDFDYQCWGN